MFEIGDVLGLVNWVEKVREKNFQSLEGIWVAAEVFPFPIGWWYALAMTSSWIQFNKIHFYGNCSSKARPFYKYQTLLSKVKRSILIGKWWLKWIVIDTWLEQHEGLSSESMPAAHWQHLQLSSSSSMSSSSSWSQFQVHYFT